MTAQVVPVALLSSYIRQLFDNDPILGDIWVEGEVSEAFTSRAGHVYFTLRDADSQIKSVLFRQAAQRQRLIPSPGDQIAAHGRVSTYEREGSYQLYVDVVEHAGQGLMALQFERLRQNLEADGLFDVARKRSLPKLPRFIGVVTSAEGAVWHDIQNVLRRRYPLAHLVLSPSAVQGTQAPAGIVAALERIQRDGRAQLVIVARGGGSAEDLACFNDERVARAVFACPVPVISAIGHETDWTILDLVADLRAPTPSAAAELCAPSVESLADEISSNSARALSAWCDGIEDARGHVAGEVRLLERLTPRDRLRQTREELRRLETGIRVVETALLPAFRSVSREEVTSFRRCGRNPLAATRARTEQLAAILDALDPNNVILRGYAVLEIAPSRRLVSSAAGVHPGQTIVARLHDGTITSSVHRIDGTQGVRHNGGR